MSTITTNDGVQIFYKDCGTGQPIVRSYGWHFRVNDKAIAKMASALPHLHIGPVFGYVLEGDYERPTGRRLNGKAQGCTLHTAAVVGRHRRAVPLLWSIPGERLPRPERRLAQIFDDWLTRGFR